MLAMRSILEATMLLIAFARIAFADPADHERVAVVAIDVGAAVPAHLTAKAATQIEGGLSAAGYDVLPNAQGLPLTSELARCREGSCVRQVGEALQVQAVVYAAITADGENIIISLRMFDTGAARQDASVHEVCELCGEAELSQRLHVAASTLRAQAVETQARLARPSLRPPVQVAPPQTPRRAEPRSIVPGVAIGLAGVATLAGGIYLIAIDGDGRCAKGDTPVFPDPGAVIRYPDPSNTNIFICRDLYTTKTLGFASTALGAAAIAFGTVMIVRARDQRDLEIMPLSHGVAVRMSLAW
jgi:hypothetical protein